MAITREFHREILQWMKMTYGDTFDLIATKRMQHHARKNKSLMLKNVLLCLFPNDTACDMIRIYKKTYSYIFNDAM